LAARLVDAAVTLGEGVVHFAAIELLQGAMPSGIAFHGKPGNGNVGRQSRKNATISGNSRYV
jgi:hypothetical protein